MLLGNPRIAEAIDAFTDRTVLLLGRFTPARKRVRHAMRKRLLERNFVLLLFDFTKPRLRDLSETVACLAQLSCVVVADLTDAKSLPQELSHIVTWPRSVPVLPLLREGAGRCAMFEHFGRCPCMLPRTEYRDLDQLSEILDRDVLAVGWRACMRARGRPRAPLPKVAVTVWRPVG